MQQAVAGQQVGRQGHLGVDKCFPLDLQSGVCGLKFMGCPRPGARMMWGGSIQGRLANKLSFVTLCDYFLQLLVTKL